MLFEKLLIPLKTLSRKAGAASGKEGGGGGEVQQELDIHAV